MHRGVALFGYRIPYTISPLIHNTAFSLRELPYTYVPVDISPESFERALEAVQTLNFAGANVTIPYKETVLKHVTTLSVTAQRIGAINTLRFDNGSMYGENTDSEGFYQAYIDELRLLRNQSVLILGAGGAARAVCDALVTHVQPQKIIIATRNQDRAIRVAAHVRDQYLYEPIVVLPNNEQELNKVAQDVAGVIQTTPVGSGTYVGKCPVPATFPFQKDQIAIDLVYNPLETPFLQYAASAGARTRNGMGMLIHQAALSFTIWTGVSFPMDEVATKVMYHIKQFSKK